MSALLLALWIAGLLGILVWSIALARRARLARSAHLAPRTAVAMAALAVGVLGTLAAHVWGTDPATRGMARIRDDRPGASATASGDAGGPGAAGQPEVEDDGPPRARLFLRYVQMRLGAVAPEAPGASASTAAAKAPGAAAAEAPSAAAETGAARSGVIGYSPRAALRLPRSYGLDESRQGWDVLEVALDGPQGLAVATIEHPEPTTTRVAVYAAPRPDAHAPAPDALARRGDALMAAGGCAGRSSGDARSARLDGPGAIYAILCAGDAPRAALVLERDLAGADTGDVPVRVVPLVWRGRRWRPHHIQVGSGSLIQIGTMADALPGVTLWEVPAPAGRAELFYPPSDILAPCAEWLSGRHGEGFFSLPLGMRPAPPASARATDDSALCVLPFTPPFGLEVRRLLPDVAGVRGRSLWAVGLAITPAVLALLALAAQARSGISARRFARLLAVGWLSALWSAMSVWRLLWAHRIDMLRDYESVGSRVLSNQIAAVLAAAALAATCASLWLIDRERDAGTPSPARPGRGLARGMLLGALAWLAWLLVGSVALRGDAAALPHAAGLLGHAAMSLAVGTAPLWLPHAWRAAMALARRLSGAHTGQESEDGRGERGRAVHAGGPRAWLAAWRRAWPWSSAVLALAALAAVALATALLAPRTVALKLGLAWLFPFALYAALRSAVTMAGQALGRALITLVATGAAMLGLAALDPGVTAVIALPGAIVALLLASHDACFGEDALRRLHGYEQKLAPLVVAHAVLLGGAGLVVAVLCIAGLVAAAAGEPDAQAARTITRGAMHLALFAASLFVAAAGQAYLRRGARAAVPWLAAAVLLCGLWLLRGPLVDRVLESSAQAAHRLAIVLDPGYALLHGENKFLAGLTAWRETVVPGAAGHASAVAHPALDGQGYFGAQLIDPGVLLSIENDYFPVLVLRETGIVGILAAALLSWLLTAGAWALASARFRHGSAAQRARVLGAVLLAAVCLYQPLAALGALPLTGVAWPGFGLDSPSDLWVFLALALWLLVWEPQDAPGDEAARERAQLERFDVELRGARVFRRVRAAAAAAAVLVALAGTLVLARSAAFALRRPNPVDAEGQAVAPFDGLVRAVDYAHHLQCPWPHRVAPAASAAGAGGDAGEGAAGIAGHAAGDPAEALVPADLLGEPDAPGVTRFHDALRARWREQRPMAVDALRRFLAGDDAACGSAAGPVQRGAWRFERSPEAPAECRMRWKVGWPEVELAVTRAPAADAIGDGADTLSDNATGATEPEPAGAIDRMDDRDDGSDDGQAGLEGAPDQTGAADGALADTAPAHSARCSIELRTDVLRVLRFPARRPYRDARVRLVSRAMGAAALDRGELVSGHLAVRLRPGAGTIDVAHARAGLYAGHEVRISPELTIVLGDGENGAGHAVLRRAASPGAPGATPGTPAEAAPDSWLFVRDPPPARVRVLAAEEGTWKLMPPGIAEMPLDRLTLIVVGGPDARSLWLFRPPQPWTEAGADAVVDPLLADDITTVRGERRRHYLYGGLLPELGWVNPFHGRMSLGLDGWVRVATAEYERTPRAQREGPQVWLDDGREVPYCGTLAAATPEDSGAETSAETGADSATETATPASSDTRSARAGAERDASSLARVCRRSALDGVLECRVSLQPELAVRLRHLTELVSLAPERFGGAGSAAPMHAGYVLLRGDTGEIVAQGELVPGRASSAYAPATPEIEQVLVRLREDRDPATGRRLPPERRGEDSAEKIDWNQPIAVGSTMKPFLARALELAAPEVAARLTLRGAPTAAAACAAGRGRASSARTETHALLGHCPPTDSLWNHHGSYDLAGFLSASVNWFQAAIGLWGTALPGGAWGFGEDTAEAWDGQPGPDASALIAGNVGSHAPDRALWTGYQGRRVVSARGTVDLAALRRTPMWQRFEELLGRPLCLLGSKRRCRRAHAQRDLCAARALPIDQPTRDLRHLVALGPSAFDFYPPLADPSRRLGPRVRTREYLQFLRGSGLHPLGSLAQSADAFNRLIYERAGADGPGDAGADAGAYRLAASWFPVPVSGNAPVRDCRAGGGGVHGGLCDVLDAGTARDLRDLRDDPRFTFHGAKTGTIDSLGDVAESSAACAHFRTGHTVPDRPARAASQPYWLPCGAKRAPAEINDSLLLLGFTVHTPAGDVPLTLGLRFQRSGPGFATRVARHYIEVVHAYFAPGQAGAPASPPTPAGPASEPD